MTSKANELNIVDLEATCWKDGHPPVGQKQEIIEIGIVVFDIRTKQIRHRNSFYIFPETSEVTPYCTELTGITEEKLKKRARPFEVVMNDVARLYGRNRAWASWGDWDRKILTAQCEEYNVPFPFSTTHYNLKHMVSMLTGGGRMRGLGEALRYFNMDFDGEPHRADADAYNTARIAARVI